MSQVVDDDALDDAVEEVVQEFAHAADGRGRAWPSSSCIARRPATSNDALEREALTEELAVRSDDFKEGMRAFVQRRDPDYPGR